MNIAILGSGNIGGTIGRRLAPSHSVTFGVRDGQTPEVLKLLRDCGPQTRAASPAEAARGADVVLLAVPGSVVESMVGDLAPDLRGKVVIDATNPIGAGFVLTAGGAQAAGAERLAGLAPGARIVKAFNAAGFNIWADPRFGTESADLYLCGDDPSAREIVASLGRELGLTPVDCGPLSSARLLEPLALLWITLAMKQGRGREIAFKLMSR